MKLNAKTCKEPLVCFVKRPSATSFMNWSTSTQNSSFAQGSTHGRWLPGNRCSGPCCYLRRSLTFRPRVQCCVAWYNALPAHLPSTIEWVQKRALRIIYLLKLYNLLELLELRTGAVGSVWALQTKAGPCQPDLVNQIIYLFILFVYLFNTHSILQSIYQHLLLNFFSQNT